VPASTDEMMDIFVCGLLLVHYCFWQASWYFSITSTFCLKNLMLKNDYCFGCLNSGLIEIPFRGTYPNPGDTDVQLWVYYILLIC
jgi:hypothetical protein